MIMASKKTFTLGDLAKIALGTSELTNEHLRVLRSLLIILLHKLNCQDEIVRIGGFPAKCVEKLLNDKLNESPYNFKFESVKGFQEKYELLRELERKAQAIDLQMQKHYQDISNCYKTNIFTSTKWEFYASPAEDLCTLYMKENKEVCLLLQNSVFNIELRKRVVPQIMQRFRALETKINSMQSQLQNVIHLADKTAVQLKFIDFAIKDIESIHSAVDSEAMNFRETLLKIQEMLNCKLQRVTLPALRKYLEQRFVAIRESLRTIKLESKKCHATQPLNFIDNKTCLSCSRRRRGRGRQEVHISIKFPIVKSIDEDKKCSCSDLLKEPTIFG